MELYFSYDIEKDIQNFISSTTSINNKRLTKFVEAYIEKNGDDFNSGKIGSFINDHLRSENLDIDGNISRVEREWLKVKDIFIARVESMFGIEYPHDIVRVFLTTNNRCTYNIPENYFFVTIGAKSPVATIMHELFHFYTYYVFAGKFKERGIFEGEYNNFKEALTELLNVEFTDLMAGAIDAGYPQHQELRKRIKDLWSQQRSLQVVYESIYV
jgi:hypothetical protein